ncbi:hypothetical protein QYM36_018490 [Artemia franciscana]|uniref:EF-hand domain-containing protein n=1 Tax=Artemia franciscana TaxID=6661 RepID=A0AA88L0B8_ARTSF|nr:hypothetical protein QYM36_018490 [Artemia franciscana]
MPLASQFTDVQMEDLRASFALFDQDGNGHITTSELTAVMKCLGQNPTDAEILAIIKEVDADGNGTIEFSEFVIAMAKSVNDIDAEKEIKEVFDKDGNGHTNVEELRYVSVNLGETFSDEDIAEMLKQADFDGDGVFPTNLKHLWSSYNSQNVLRLSRKTSEPIFEISGLIKYQLQARIKKADLNLFGCQREWSCVVVNSHEFIFLCADFQGDQVCPGHNAVKYNLGFYKASQFTDVQMEDLRASFALFDQDGNGHITTSELTAVMKCLGQNPTDAEILAIIKEVDADGNGTIEFSEFVIAMAKSVNDIDAEKEIKEVFDKDGNGHINVEELRYVSVNLGETFSDEDIAEMLKQADFDGEGVVNYKGMTEAL